MLKTLDVLIGLSVVMLLLSMIVTVITQFVTGFVNSRGKHLREGIADILEQIDPVISRKIAAELAEAVLRHPLVCDRNGKLGSVIHREELTKLLLEFASGKGSQPLSQEAGKALQVALVNSKVCNAGTQSEIQNQVAELVNNIGQLALQLELAHPELTNEARARIAILQQASSQFLGKINLWFDQTMDRVADRFTQHTRFVTFFAGLLIALLLQLDTAALVKRLSADDALRNTMVQDAQQIKNDPGKTPEYRDLQDLTTNNLVGMPLSVSDWRGRWSWDNAATKIFGIVLSSILLSLGAPFWYNALQNLIRLRSLVAVKDDLQRRERQISGPTAAAAAGANAAADDRSISLDERGDLSVVG
jgi:hypothetical protein